MLDLGLARFHSGTSARHERTGLGEGMGTVDYMAPEQALDAHSVDIRADVYSLGCTLYHLLAGQPPFSGFPERERAEADRHAVPPLIASRRPDVTPGLARVLERMLAKDPAHRYQTPAEVVAALAPFAGAPREQSPA